MTRRWRSATVLCLVVAGGCHESPVIPDAEPELTELQVGESRSVELRYLRLDVEGFEKSHGLEELRAMPRRVLEDVWLLDIDMTPLMTNALTKLRDMGLDEIAELQPAARNMHTLLTMTPDNAVLDGTNLEELIDLSAAVGLPPAKALANLIATDVTADFIPPSLVAEGMLDHLVASHPNMQARKGPVDEEHPDGLYPITPRGMPVTLADVVTNFDNMAERFGPMGGHPGVVVDVRGVTIVEEEFAIISRVRANALPFKGVDLTSGARASVNSVGSQIETVHDFSDPDWLRIEGLAPEPRVEELTFALPENDAFVPGGTSRDPAGQGDSPGWELPPWQFERLILEISRLVGLSIDAHCNEYELGTGVKAFTACIDDGGWVTLETFNNAGSPPAPSYLWDLDLEIAQARLHDGGLAEGEGDVQLTVRDVEVGVPPEVVVEQSRENIKANPEALREFASLITNSTVGDADFYYVRPESGGDWLYFVSEHDIRLDEEGEPVRGYDYPEPGFFADAGLRDKISSPDELDGDAEHEKVRVEPGDVVYVGDDQGRVFEVAVAGKPSRARLTLDVTRLE